MLVIQIHPTATTPVANELITSFPCTIGSDPSNTLVIEHPTVAARHVVLDLQGKTLVAKAASAGSSIVLAGQRASQVAVTENRTIQIGQVTIDLLVNSKQNAGRFTKAVITPSKPKPTAPKELVEKLPKAPPPSNAKTFASGMKLAIIAIVLFKVYQMSATSVKSVSPLGNLQAQTAANKQALRELAPEISPDEAAASATPAPQQSPNQSLNQNLNQAQAHTQTQTQTPTQTQSPPAEAPLAQTDVAKSADVPGFDRPRSAPERILAAITDRPRANKLFALFALGLILGTIVKLRNPITSLIIPFFRAVSIFGFLLSLGHALRFALPVLNFNIDNAAEFSTLAGTAVFLYFLCIFQGFMQFLMPEHAFHKRALAAMAATALSSVGISRAAEKYGWFAPSSGLPFKGTIAMPLRTFTPATSSAEELYQALDSSLSKVRPR